MLPVVSEVRESNSYVVACLGQSDKDKEYNTEEDTRNLDNPWDDDWKLFD